MYQPFPGLGNCRENFQEISGCTWDVLGRHMPSTLSISLQCPCNVPARYTAPCPQCVSSRPPSVPPTWPLMAQLPDRALPTPYHFCTIQATVPTTTNLPLPDQLPKTGSPSSVVPVPESKKLMTKIFRRLFRRSIKDPQRFFITPPGKK